MRHNWKCLEANEENVVFTGASLIDINWNTASFSKLLPDPIVFTSGLAYAKRMCCLLKSCLCLCYIVKGIHSVCGVGFMMCSMGLSVGHILVKGKALSSKSSWGKLESAAAGDGKMNKQFLMGYRAAAKSVQGLWMAASLKGLGMCGPQITLLLRQNWAEAMEYVYPESYKNTRGGKGRRALI